MRPDLVLQERSDDESGKNQARLDLPDLYTGIWWYASYPNHYAGEESAGSSELGKLITDHYVETAVKNLRVIKNDEKTLQLQVVSTLAGSEAYFINMKLEVMRLTL